LAAPKAGDVPNRGLGVVLVAVFATGFVDPNKLVGAAGAEPAGVAGVPKRLNADEPTKEC
jgi:hypothetical protein